MRAACSLQINEQAEGSCRICWLGHHQIVRLAAINQCICLYIHLDLVLAASFELLMLISTHYLYDFAPNCMVGSRSVCALYGESRGRVLLVAESYSTMQVHTMLVLLALGIQAHSKLIVSLIKKLLAHYLTAFLRTTNAFLRSWQVGGQKDL